MKHTLFQLFIILLLLTLPAQAVTVKIGSLAPARSPWHKAIKKLGMEWKKITGGKVVIKIFPGGIAGSEEDVIRKIRIGTLGGGALSNMGLTHITPDVYVLNIPLLIQSDQELDYVLQKMRTRFEKEIEAKGFKMIVWSMSGWVNFFTKHPVISPDDLKKHKISFVTGEPIMENAWKKCGFHVVSHHLKDLMMALQGGMSDAFFLSPLLAASGQYFALVPNMCSLKIAPVVGGVVISQRVWKRVPAQYKEAMMKAAERISEKLYRQTRELEKETIAEMKKHGLKVREVPEAMLPQWKAASDESTDELVDKLFSKEIYDIVKKHLDQFRKRK
ncbi:MAG: C4-dicarboxylate ABC transporter substrate-binding protein [bacterium]|nr:C4-dicarboxylate ABC transporter substrate-binding protein [bacterium]